MATDESGYEASSGAMACDFKNCILGIVNKTNDRLNKTMHFKLSFVPVGLNTMLNIKKHTQII